MKYCTYLTTYSGNKLPPFYIGYSTVKKVEKGYHGSVSSRKYKETWLREQSENPEAFKTRILTRHETREEAKIREMDLQKKLSVIKNPLYTNKAIGCHADNTGRKLSDEHKILLSSVHTGTINLKSRGKKRSLESRLKMSIARKRHSGPNKGIKFSKERKATMYTNRGKKLSPETKAKMKASQIRRREWESA